MIRLRLVVPAVLVAGALAGCLTYFVTYRYFVTPLGQVDTGRRLPATIPTLIGRNEPSARITGQHPTAEQQAAAAFERAAKTILKQLPNAMAYAGTDEPLIVGHVPLPRRRPIPR
jgi:hypothetical protein